MCVLYASFFVCLVLAWHFPNLSKVVERLLLLSSCFFPYEMLLCKTWYPVCAVRRLMPNLFKWHLPEFCIFIYHRKTWYQWPLKILPFVGSKKSCNFTQVLSCAKAREDVATLCCLISYILQLSYSALTLRTVRLQWGSAAASPLLSQSGSLLVCWDYWSQQSAMSCIHCIYLDLWIVQVKIDTECKLWWRSHYTLKKCKWITKVRGKCFYPPLK